MRTRVRTVLEVGPVQGAGLTIESRAPDDLKGKCYSEVQRFHVLFHCCGGRAVMTLRYIVSRSKSGSVHCRLCSRRHNAAKASARNRERKLLIPPPEKHRTVTWPTPPQAPRPEGFW